MARLSWPVAAASAFMIAWALPALAQQPAPARPPNPPATAPNPPTRPAVAPQKAATPKPSAPRSQPRPAQPAPKRVKPNTSYSYCRGVARQMRLRGAERRRAIADCQLGIPPSVSKG
jgi:hypothetical protein